MPQWPNGLHGLVGENIISEKKKKKNIILRNEIDILYINSIHKFF